MDHLAQRDARIQHPADFLAVINRIQVALADDDSRVEADGKVQYFQRGGEGDAPLDPLAGTVIDAAFPHDILTKLETDAMEVEVVDGLQFTCERILVPELV